MDFRGHITMVTGAGAGIGRGTALAFAEAGATVVAVDVNAEAVLETADLIQSAAGGRALARRADVGVEASVDEAFARAGRELDGRINSLINVAGVELYKPLLDVSDG